MSVGADLSPESGLIEQKSEQLTKEVSHLGENTEITMRTV